MYEIIWIENIQSWDYSRYSRDNTMWTEYNFKQFQIIPVVRPL